MCNLKDSKTEAQTEMGFFHLRQDVVIDQGLEKLDFPKQYLCLGKSYKPGEYLINTWAHNQEKNTKAKSHFL